jgi:hypothetical protein
MGAAGEADGRVEVMRATRRALSAATWRTLLAASLLVVAALPGALAQTPAQMEYERQQREYWRQQEQQRQEQQRQQQLMQDNARRQQEESARAARANLPQSPGAAAPMGGGAGGGGALGGPAGAQLEQARQVWLKRPPLPPAQNPLLGAWTRPQARINAADPFAQVGALMKGGLCEVFFSGDAVFEFKPAALMGIDKRTRQGQTLDQVEYRGEAGHVVVIPRTTLKLIVFDFDGPDRIRWSGQNCVLTRVGATSAAKAR